MRRAALYLLHAGLFGAGLNGCRATRRQERLPSGWALVSEEELSALAPGTIRNMGCLTFGCTDILTVAAPMGLNGRAACDY